MNTYPPDEIEMMRRTRENLLYPNINIPIQLATHIPAIRDLEAMINNTEETNGYQIDAS